MTKILHQNNTTNNIQEDFLHYLWKNKLLLNNELKLSNGKILTIISYGEYNQHSGPDFLNVHLKIENIEWVGNVEMHINSSHWYTHGHEKDSNYGNVILHVVWEHDIEVFDFQSNIIPTLELKNIISTDLLQKYQQLLQSQTQFIHCENLLKDISENVWNQWKKKLYIERLKEKSKLIFSLLAETNNDWEAVLFRLLMRNFGGNINGEAFEQIARSIPFLVIRKEANSIKSLEALLFGQAKLIPDEPFGSYEFFLFEEYQYLKHKYNLDITNVSVQFFRLRPANFPTLRMSLLANLYHQEKTLFSKCLSLNNISDLEFILNKITTSNYWKTHYTFSKDSPSKVKKISKSLQELIWINTIIPIQYTYYLTLNEDKSSVFYEKLKKISVEENSILSNYKKIGVSCKNASDSQGFLQLYKKYCTQHKCLTCDIGIQLLR